MINGVKIVAVCTSGLNDNKTYDFVHRLNDLLVEENCRIFVYHICSDFYWTQEKVTADAAIFNLIDYKVVDAIILMDEKIKSQRISGQIIDNANSNNVPIIIVDKVSPNCISINFDYKNGFEKIVRHVVEEHGVKKLHFMAGFKDNVFSEDRLDVFKKVIAENGIEFSQDMVSYGKFWADPTIEAMEVLIAKGDIPEGIICANDIMAINVCAVLENHGYKVPDDVVVTGFDGIDEIFYMSPQLTSAKADYTQMAEKVFDIVRDIFNGYSGNDEYYVLPEFICAQSCGCNKEHPLKNQNYQNRMNTQFYRYQDDNKRLADISQQIQACANVDEISQICHSHLLNDISVLVNKSCLDETMNTSSISDARIFEDRLVMLHHAEDNSIDGQEFSINDVYSDISCLFYKKVPIVFNALFSLNKLLGYACVYFDKSNITNYGKLNQIISFISIGVCGYMNVKNQKYLYRKVEENYKCDSLTGLLNRKGFSIEFDKVRDELINEYGYITAVLSDLDRLKTINDSYGHLAGDKAIMETAKALKKACPDNSICVRFGGDEFLAVIPGIVDTKIIEDKIYEYLDEFNKTKELEIPISTSIGFYQTDVPREFDFDYIVSQADKKLYINKEEHHAGNN